MNNYLLQRFTTVLLKIAKTWKPGKCPTVAQLMHCNIPPMCYKNVASRDDFEEFLNVKKSKYHVKYKVRI